jgi:hypothetical protein
LVEPDAPAGNCMLKASLEKEYSKMFRLFNSTRKAFLFAACIALVIFTVAFGLSVRSSSRQSQVLKQKDRDVLLEQVEDLPELPIKVVENSDSPLKISQATVKEILGADYTKLTGRTTRFVSVASFPHAILINTSGKTITGFIFGIRDPKTKTLQTLNQRKISLPAGATYTIKREHFLAPEKIMKADNNGVRPQLSLPKADSEKYWIDFAERSDLFVTVGMVFYEDGSRWTIKEEGEIK